MRTKGSLGLAVVLTACSSSESSDLEAGGTDAGRPDQGAVVVPEDLTFYRDIKPIIDGKCVACHQPGSVGPFDLTKADGVVSLAPAIGNQVRNHLMPPWPPDDACRSYRYDRSLTETQVAMVDAWVAEGAPLGDPDEAGEPVPGEFGGLSRIDMTLQVPEPYTPEGRDDYHCFVIDWPAEQALFVTGFGLEPGNASIVHHANTYLVNADAADGFRRLDDRSAGPGFPCFGGVFASGVELMGAWAPGSVGIEFPEGTGLLVEPGSAVILEMHFNTGIGREGSDQSSVLLQTAATVERRAAILPVANPDWSTERTMDIPAGRADVAHEVVFNPLVATLFLRELAPWLASQPLEIHGAGLHMHYLGTRAQMEIIRDDDERDCVIEIPEWDFDWQSGYIMREPVPFDTTKDSLRLECRWDNTDANQPVIDGVQRPAADVNWGNNSDDEMCIGYLYLVAAPS